MLIFDTPRHDVKPRCSPLSAAETRHNEISGRLGDLLRIRTTTAGGRASERLSAERGKIIVFTRRLSLFGKELPEIHLWYRLSNGTLRPRPSLLVCLPAYSPASFNLQTVIARAALVVSSLLLPIPPPSPPPRTSVQRDPLCQQRALVARLTNDKRRI